MTETHEPQEFGIFLKGVLTSAGGLAVSIVDRLSAAERDFREGLTKLVEPTDRDKPSQAAPRP